MRTTQRTGSIAGTALAALAVLATAFVLSAIPIQAWAAVDCASVRNEPDPGPTGSDTDSDGFTDYQECGATTLANGTTVVPSCVFPVPIADRRSCLDPNSKDLFVILAPASASLLPPGYTPFNNVSYYGVEFRGFDDVLVTVHQITPAQATAERTVTGGSPQKAVKVTESLDASGSILGYCQWGTPNGLDGCTVYTQRINNFLASTCAGLSIVKADRTDSTLEELFLAYTTHVVLHETGHTSGGMTGAYNSSYGGYHYKAGDSRMEQFVAFSTKGGKCKLNFTSGWNANDSLTIELK